MTTESREQDHGSARASRKSRGSPAIIEAGGSGADDIRHGDWRIYPTGFYAHHRWREVAWTYCHDDYDGAPDAYDHRCGTAASVEACIAEIDNWEADHAA